MSLNTLNNTSGVSQLIEFANQMLAWPQALRRQVRRQREQSLGTPTRPLGKAAEPLKIKKRQQEVSP